MLQTENNTNIQNNGNNEYNSNNSPRRNECLNSTISDDSIRFKMNRSLLSPNLDSFR